MGRRVDNQPNSLGNSLIGYALAVLTPGLEAGDARITRRFGLPSSRRVENTGSSVRNGLPSNDAPHSVCGPVGCCRSSAGPPARVRLRAVLTNPTWEKA